MVKFYLFYFDKFYRFSGLLGTHDHCQQSIKILERTTKNSAQTNNTNKILDVVDLNREVIDDREEIDDREQQIEESSDEESEKGFEEDNNIDEAEDEEDNLMKKRDTELLHTQIEKENCSTDSSSPFSAARISTYDDSSCLNTGLQN